MGTWSTQRQWTILLAGLFVVGEAVLAPQSGWIAWLGHLGLAGLLVGGVVALAQASEQRVASSLRDLEDSILRLGKGDFELPVEPPTAAVVARIAGALEHSRRRLAKHHDELVRAKTVLSDELAQARDRLSDPETERRLTGLSHLGLAVELEVSGVRHAVDLADLWLDHVELALDRPLAKEMVCGQPATIRLTGPDGVVIEDHAVAQRATRTRHGGRVGWSFDWAAPMAPAALWPPLWQAINPRAEFRVCPPEDHALRAVLHVDERSHTARVLDLSKGGVGVFVDESMEALGLVGHGAVATLTVQLPGERTVRERVWVRSAESSEEGTRLGLALEGLNQSASQTLAAYLVEIQQAPEPTEAPLAFAW